MKKRPKMDLMHESMGERELPMLEEHRRHGERLHQEMVMHHKKHPMHKGRMEHSSMPYEHEVDKPKMPSDGHMIPGFGIEDFKGEADPIAYGQAAGEGMKSDMRKIQAQFKQYHWD